ncbi:MAG TPA: RDD family protein [Candidatus Nanoarchaeia archaeon]|nr:RDD family protein [Candidatus Nanoarchaeia archaeon]
MPYCKNCGNELQSDTKFCPKCGTPVEAPSPTTSAAPTIQPGITLAHWGERFVAWLIDIIIIGLIVGILGFFSWFATGNFDWYPGWPTWVPFFNFNFGSVIYFLYWMLTEGAYGQSLGKMFIRLKITRLNSTPMNIGQAALESVGKAFFLPLDLLLGLIFSGRRRQRIFNYISETIVIEDKRR